MAIVASELDQNEDFRALVAEGLDTDEPDRASWLFLTRPAGWIEDLTMLIDVAAEESEQASTEARLRESERHLATTRTALDDTRSELATAQARITELQSQISDLRSAITDAEGAVEELQLANRRLGEDRDRAVKNLKTTEELATARLDRIRELQTVADTPTDDGPPGSGSVTTTPRDTTAERSGKDDAVSTPVVDPNAVGDGDTGDRRPRSVERGDVDASTGDGGTGDPSVDTVALAGSFRDAINALQQLGDALGSAATAIGLTDLMAGDDLSGQSAETASGRESFSQGQGRRDEQRSPSPTSPQRSRRTPIRLRRGAVEGSADAIEQLLSTPGVIVLVDGYNVAMAAWPGLSKTAQRDSLIRMAADAASRYGTDIHLVFDGVGDGTRPNVTTALPVRVHFSDSDTEADDVIIDMVAATTGPMVVVTSDRRIIDAVRQMGANVTTSADMIDFVRGRASGQNAGRAAGRFAGGRR